MRIHAQGIPDEINTYDGISTIRLNEITRKSAKTDPWSAQVLTGQAEEENAEKWSLEEYPRNLEEILVSVVFQKASGGKTMVFLEDRKG